MTDHTVTRPFITTAGDYFSIVLGAWMRRYGWSLLIPVCAFLGLGLYLHDERWYIVALLVCFIIAPMVMSFVYTYYMLTPEARRAVLPRRVIISHGHDITLEYLSRNALSDDEEKAPDDPDERIPEPETIPWSNVLEVRSTSRFRVYTLSGDRMQFVIIPWSALRH